MWVIISRIILRFRFAILVVVFLSTFFMLYHAKDVKLSYQMAEILPKTSQVFHDYQNFKNNFGNNKNKMVIGVKDPNLFQIDRYKAWLDLSKEIKAIDGVENTTSISDIFLLRKDTIRKKFHTEIWYNPDLSSQEEFDKSVTHLLNEPFYK